MTAPSSGEDKKEVVAAAPAAADVAPVTISIEKPSTAQSGKHRRIAPKPPISPIKKGISLILLGCIVYTLFGFLIAPLLITSLLPAALEKKINRPVTIGSAQVNPFRFDIILKNGIIGAEKNDINDKADPLFSFGRLKIKLQPGAIFTGQPPFQAIHGNSVFLHIVRDKDQTLNLQHLINKTTETTPFNLKAITNNLKDIDLKLTDAKVLFDDQDSDTTHTINQIRFHLPAGEKQGESPYFSASINGSPIEFGDFTHQTNTGEQHFVLHFKDINLPSYLNYLPAPFPQLFSKGKTDLELSITTSQTAKVFSLSVSGTGTAKDLWLNDAKGNHNKIDAATFNFSGNLTDKKIIFHKLILEKPEFHLSRTPNGQFSFPAKETFISKEPLQGLEIETILIKNGKLVFIDQNVPGGFGASFNDVNLSIDKNSTTNTRPYALNCITNRKTRIASQGTITPNGWQIQGLFILNDLPLSALNSYLPKSQGISITSGLVEKFETSFTLSPLAPQKLTTLADATINIKKLGLSLKGQEILSIPTTKISTIHFSQAKQIATLGDLQLQGGYFQIDSDNPFPLPVHQPTGKQLLWNINHLSIKNSMTHLRGFPFQDKPLTIGITNLSAENISADSKEKATIKTSLTLLKSATWVAEGTVQFNPFRGILDSEIKHLYITDIPAPLLNWLKPPLLGGSLSAQGQLTFPDLSFTGDTTIRKLKLRHGEQHDLFTTKKIHLKEGTYTLSPPQIHIKQAQLDEMQTGLSISKKKLFKHADFFIEKKDSELKNVTQVAIDKIIFNKSQFTFRDQTTKPPFNYAISQVTGTIDSLNSQGTGLTHINFTGTGSNQTHFSLSGSTKLFTDNFTADLNGTIKDFPLTEIKSFIEPITGYGLQGGIFNLTVKYQENMGTMKGETNLDIRHLTLSTEDKGNSHFPDIVALLTDANHQIKLNLPFTGNTTDPSYTFQSAYGKKLRELTLATMVSPYSALGDYFDDKENPPNQIFFIPGTSELGPGQENILLALQTIINNRPLLHITLEGFSGSQEDRAALLKKKQDLEEKRDQKQALATGNTIVQNYGKELLSAPTANQPPVLPPKKIQLTKQELQDLATRRIEQVKQILIEQFALKGNILHIDTTPTVVPQSDTGTQGHRVEFILTGSAP